MSTPAVNKKEMMSTVANTGSDFSIDLKTQTSASTSSITTSTEDTSTHKRKNFSSTFEKKEEEQGLVKKPKPATDDSVTSIAQTEDTQGDDAKEDDGDSIEEADDESSTLSVQQTIDLMKRLDEDNYDDEDSDEENSDKKTSDLIKLLEQDDDTLWDAVSTLLTEYAEDGSDYFAIIQEILSSRLDPNGNLINFFIGDSLLDSCLRRAIADRDLGNIELLTKWGADINAGITAAIKADSVELLEQFKDDLDDESVTTTAEVAAERNDPMQLNIIEYFLEQDFETNSALILEVAVKEMSEVLINVVCEYADIDQTYELAKILVKNDRAVFLTALFDCFPMQELLKNIHDQDEGQGVYEAVVRRAKDVMSSSITSDDELHEFLDEFAEMELETNFLVYPKKKFNGDKDLQEIRQAFNSSARTPDENKILASFIGVHSSTANRYLVRSPYFFYNQEGSENYFRSGHHPFNIFITPKFARHQFHRELPEFKVIQKHTRSAHIGAYNNQLEGLIETKGIDRSKLPQKELEYSEDSELYDNLLEYRHRICKYIADQVQLPTNALIQVGFYNDYPCVMVMIKSKECSILSSSAKKPSRKAIEGWVQIIISYFVGLVNYYAQRTNIDIELVRRQSFGFLTPTIAVCGQSFRINVGIVPTDHADIIVNSLRLLNKVLILLDGDLQTVNTNLPQRCFINDEDYKKYLDGKIPVVKTLLDLVWAKVEKGGKTGAVNLMKSSAARDGFAAKVYQQLYSTKQSPTAAQFAEIFLIALRWSFSHQRLLIMPKKITLHYDKGNEKIAFPKIIDQQLYTQIKDDEFFRVLNVIVKAIRARRPRYIHTDFDQKLDTMIERHLVAALNTICKTIQQKTVAGLYNQLELLNELLFSETLSKFSGEVTEDDGYGSASDGEDDDICYDKIIVENGMRAILTALHAGVDSMKTNKSKPQESKPRTLFIHGAYYEVLIAMGLLKNFTVIKQVSDIAAAEIVIHDTNACVTNQQQLKEKLSLDERQLANVKFLIIDSTSATTKKCSEWLDKFRELPKMQALCFVASGFKHEQLGADKNQYGTVRIYTRDKALLQRILHFIMKHEKPINCSVAHHCRRYMKVLTATPRNCSIVHARTKVPTANTSLSSSSVYSSSTSTISTSSVTSMALTSSMATAGILTAPVRSANQVATKPKDTAATDVKFDVAP